jgi:hypothetical protein
MMRREIKQGIVWSLGTAAALLFSYTGHLAYKEYEKQCQLRKFDAYMKEEMKKEIMRGDSFQRRIYIEHFGIEELIDMPLKVWTIQKGKEER